MRVVLLSMRHLVTVLIVLRNVRLAMQRDACLVTLVGICIPLTVFLPVDLLSMCLRRPALIVTRNVLRALR